MSKEKTLARETSIIDDENSLIEVKKGHDGYIWSEVYVKSDKEKHYVGIYVIDGDPYHRQWLVYNQQYVSILSQASYEEEVFSERVVRMFDVQAKHFVKGTSDELKAIYDYSFGNQGSKEGTK